MEVIIALIAVIMTVLPPETQGTRDSEHPRESRPLNSGLQGESSLEEAQRLLKAGKLNESLDAYRRLLKEDPKNEQALFGMALALYKLGMIDDAVLAYEGALRIDPKLWEAETNLGMLWLERRRYDKASDHLARAQELKPDNFQIALLRAQADEALSKPGTIQQYEQALSLARQPLEQFEVHRSLGRLLTQRNNWLEAEKHYLAAKQLQSESVVDRELAEMYFQSGQPNKCVDLLQELAQRPETSSPFFELLARAYDKLGRTDQAIQSQEIAVAREKDAARKQQLTLDLVQMCEASGQTDKAIDLLRSYAPASANADLLFHLGTLHLKRKELDPAMACFSRVLSLKPSCIECYSNIGSVLLLQEKYAEAVNALQHFKAARPEVAGTYFYMGLAFDKLDQVEQAFQHYQRFLELDSGRSDKQDFQARERMKVLEKRRKKR